MKNIFSLLVFQGDDSISGPIRKQKLRELTQKSNINVMWPLRNDKKRKNALAYVSTWSTTEVTTYSVLLNNILVLVAKSTIVLPSPPIHISLHTYKLTTADLRLAAISGTIVH